MQNFTACVKNIRRHHMHASSRGHLLSTNVLTTRLVNAVLSVEYTGWAKKWHPFSSIYSLRQYNATQIV